MARAVVLGNSGLTVGLDENGLVHDFYYPYVGLENLTTARSEPHHVGVWVDGEFSWVHENEWQKDVTFHEDALVSDVTMTHEKLKVGLHFEDFVDANHDIFARKIRVRNLSGNTRDVRLFFHQVFQISAEGRADTAMYVPDGHYVLDYKGRCSILAYAETEDGEPFDQHAVGNAGIEGKEGTFRDAEDGELSMSAVEHASVDSTLRVSLQLAPGDSKVVRYWLAVSDSQDQLEKLHGYMLNGGFDTRLLATLQHWHDWLKIADNNLVDVTNLEHVTAIKKSLLVIKAHTDEHGGVIASCDSSIYNYGRDYYSYVWPRDGAFAMWPLIKLGYTKEPKRFFDFCVGIMHPDGYLKHKYQPDRAVGSTWHPLVHDNRKELAIQEDETAIVLIMLGQYLKYSNDTDYIESIFESFILPAAEFLHNFIDEETGLPHASYDLWEEKLLTSTYTVATTYQALLVSAHFADMLDLTSYSTKWGNKAQELLGQSSMFYDGVIERYIKGFHFKGEDGVRADMTLDISSFYGVYAFNYYENTEQLHGMLKTIEHELLDVSPSGGSARYEDDMYFRSPNPYKGNPWFVTTLWLAQYYAQNNNTQKALEIVGWTLKHALPSGLLSEQINPENGNIVGVTPLIWSHAELINAILDL